ncbi:hypothetical protein [Streptomyces sp. NPDC002587]
MTVGESRAAARLMGRRNAPLHPAIGAGTSVLAACTGEGTDEPAAANTDASSAPGATAPAPSVPAATASAPAPAPTVPSGRAEGVVRPTGGGALTDLATAGEPVSPTLPRKPPGRRTTDDVRQLPVAHARNTLRIRHIETCGTTTHVCTRA